MGKIRQLREDQLINGGSQEHIYPITYAKAVYSKDGEGLQGIIDSIREGNFLKDGSIKTRHLKDRAVTTEKIAKNSVSRVELTSDVRASIDEKADAEQVNNSLYDLEKKIGERFVIEGDVTNLPDEEDLTSVKESERDVLKLADRSYAPEKFSGKGYKILRRNIKPVSIAVTKIRVESAPSSDGTLSFTINGKETQVAVSASTDNTTALVAQKVASAFQESITEYEVLVDTSLITLTRKSGGSVTPSVFSASTTGIVCTVTDSTKREFRNLLTAVMLSKANTIYEIRYDFDLDGKTIEMQEGCTLNFSGGSFSNGTLLGRDTRVADIKCNNVKYDGTFLCDTLHINSNSVGNNINLVNILSHFTTLSIELETDIDNVITDNSIIQNIKLNGNGHTIRVPKLNFADNVNIYHAIFDTILYQAKENSDSCFIDSNGKDSSLFSITDCKFINLNGGAIFVVSHTNPKINNCSFTGTLLDDSEKKNIPAVVRLYKCSGNITINGNHIENCYGIGLNIISNTNISGAVITYNYINKVTGGGIISSGNILKNVECHDNIVMNANHLSNTRGDAESSSINFHGFYNLLLHDNYLESPKAFGMDINGDDNKNVGRGKVFEVYNNKTVNCLQSAFFRVEDGTIYNNIFSTNQESSFPQILLTGINTVFKDNSINDKVAATTKRLEIISIGGSTSFQNSIDIIENNIFAQTTNDVCWLKVNKSANGIIQVLNNNIQCPNTAKQIFTNYNNSLQVQFLSCYPSIIKTINLSKPNKIYLRKSSGENIARLIAVRYCNYSKPTNSKELSIGIGLAKDGWNRDSLYGTFKIPKGTIPDVWTNLDGDILKDNATGDVYLSTPGGGDDVDVQIEVTFEPLDGISYY